MAVLIHGQYICLLVSLLIVYIACENEASCSGAGPMPSVVVNNYDAGGLVEERLERLEAQLNNTSVDDACSLTTEIGAELKESLDLLRGVLMRMNSDAQLKTKQATHEEDAPMPKIHPMRDCSDVVDVDNDSDGMYTIYPAGSNMPTRVYCEIRNDTNGRVAYTVIQQRVDETVDFHRNWKEYRDGFGEIGASTNFYIGNELIHQITSQRQYTIWFEGTRFARDVEYDSWEDEFTDHSEEDNMIYNSFSLMNEMRRYAVLISQYTGQVIVPTVVHDRYQDSRYNRGITSRYAAPGKYRLETSENNATAFSTFDYSISGDIATCARNMESGWWFQSIYCDSTLNVNVPYKMPTRDSREEGVPWRGRHYRKITVKIAPRFH